MSPRHWEVVVVDGTGVVFRGPVLFDSEAEAQRAATALTCVRGEVREVFPPALWLERGDELVGFDESSR